MMWSKHSRRIDPINRSAKPFCQGEAGAVGLSRMPMARIRSIPRADMKEGLVEIRHPPVRKPYFVFDKAIVASKVLNDSAYPIPIAPADIDAGLPAQIASFKIIRRYLDTFRTGDGMKHGNYAAPLERGQQLSDSLPERQLDEHSPNKHAPPERACSRFPVQLGDRSMTASNAGALGSLLNRKLILLVAFIYRLVKDSLRIAGRSPDRRGAGRGAPFALQKDALQAWLRRLSIIVFRQ
jgi:hypothetical protein